MWLVAISSPPSQANGRLNVNMNLVLEARQDSEAHGHCLGSPLMKWNMKERETSPLGTNNPHCGFGDFRASVLWGWHSAGAGNRMAVYLHGWVYEHLWDFPQASEIPGETKGFLRLGKRHWNLAYYPKVAPFVHLRRLLRTRETQVTFLELCLEIPLAPSLGWEPLTCWAWWQWRQARQSPAKRGLG